MIIIFAIQTKWAVFRLAQNNKVRVTTVPTEIVAGLEVIFLKCCLMNDMSSQSNQKRPFKDENEFLPDLKVQLKNEAKGINFKQSKTGTNITL